MPTQFLKNILLSLNVICYLNVQATDVPEYEFDVQADEKETAANKEGNEDDTKPERFTCYEMLMDAKPNPDVLEPIGEGLWFHLQLFIFCTFSSSP